MRGLTGNEVDGRAAGGEGVCGRNKLWLLSHGKKERVGQRCYMTTHWQPVSVGAYGSSCFPNVPHTDGTRGSLVDLQCAIKLPLASLTRFRGLARSSRRRSMCSHKRRYLSSDMDCLWGRELMMMDGWVGTEENEGYGALP